MRPGAAATWKLWWSSPLLWCPCRSGLSSRWCRRWRRRQRWRRLHRWKSRPRLRNRPGNRSPRRPRQRTNTPGSATHHQKTQSQPAARPGLTTHRLQKILPLEPRHTQPRQPPPRRFARRLPLHRRHLLRRYRRSATSRRTIPKRPAWPPRRERCRCASTSTPVAAPGRSPWSAPAGPIFWIGKRCGRCDCGDSPGTTPGRRRCTGSFFVWSSSPSRLFVV